MILNSSFDLYNELVNKDKYCYMFDLNVICQVNETLNNMEILLNDDDFKKLCNEVKRQYLKYNDVVLNDELVEEIYNELQYKGVIK